MNKFYVILWLLDSIQYFKDSQKDFNSGAKTFFSEKATKCCEIFTLILPVFTVDKSKVKISQNFVAFSEYTNFNWFGEFKL